MREIRVADATGSEPATLLGSSEVIDDLREVFLSAPSQELATRHVAAMLVLCEATRHLSRDARRKRRRLAVGSSFGLGAALVVGAGVAAAAGELPDPLQQAVASVAEPLGVDLPGGRSDDAPGRGGQNPGGSNDAPGQQPPSGNSETAPGHGGENPGRSSTAPGHSDAGNNRPGGASDAGLGATAEPKVPDTSGVVGPPVVPGPPAGSGQSGQQGKADSGPASPDPGPPAGPPGGSSR